MLPTTLRSRPLFETSGYVPKARWLPGGKLAEAKLRQATIAAWALLLEDSATLLDALEYSDDVLAAFLTEFDVGLLLAHARIDPDPHPLFAPPVVAVAKSASDALRSSLSSAARLPRRVTARPPAFVAGSLPKAPHSQPRMIPPSGVGPVFVCINPLAALSLEKGEEVTPYTWLQSMVTKT
jgi:hypothetical protein